MSLSTIIVGGGIGGLSLARELHRRGLSAVVLERATKLATVGAGIIMNPNAMAVLEGNGLASCVRSRSAGYLARDTFDQRGRRLATRDYRPLYAAGRLAIGALCHRAHLHECLYDGLPAGTVHLDTRIVGLADGTDGVRVETESGQTFAGDVLIGADGIHSMVRTRFFGPNEPAYLGYRSHRFVVENRDRLEHFTEFLGHGRRVGLVPIGGSQLYVWTTFNSPRASRAWALESPQAFRALFAEFTDSRVRTALGALESIDAVVCTDIEEVHQATWIRGRVALLGDAAHALTPNMGQGAGMAMEDAAVLAEELARAARGQTDLTAALAAYDARRRPRVETIVRLSRQIGEEGQLAGALACWLRNRRIHREGHSPERTRAALEQLLAWPPRGDGASEMATPALEVVGLRKTYVRDGRTTEVLDLERLSVADGEFVTVVGPSGCGKSTLLHVLGGFIPGDAGQIRVHGRAVVGPGPDRGMVFQEFSLFPWRTVSGNVGWALEVRGAPAAERAAVVERYLALTGLSEFRNHLPSELSGGMKQRVALARVLAFDPAVLLMDEPFGSLDAQTRETMQTELTGMWERTRKTVFFVTHDIDEAVYLGDRVVVLSARPARVREEVVITLPRPRDVAVRKSIAFLETRNRIWDLIREEKPS